MIKFFIDDKPLEVEEGTTVLTAASDAEIHIPHLCYHKAFSPEGNCRMCLVEIEGLPKLELACSTQVREGMKVYTSSEKVIEARKGVLEFLLAEHPIDCPICDKAGECKLQDYYEEYGLFESQFAESKEKREKKIEIGKNLLLDQERCILCTRCVRFLKNMTKTQELGVFERGIGSEINFYEGVPVDNNYSGNLPEICPVGAITDSDFRFQTRSWFLREEESICPLCSRGCNIFIEYHIGFPRFTVPKRVYRIKSRENHEVNGFWICDLGRYGYTYINEGRLNKIILKNEGSQKVLTWDNVLVLISERIKRLFHMNRTSRIALILNTWLSNEELFLFKKIFLDDLKVEKVFFLEPPEQKGDEFLLTPERSPNRKGAQEIGFDIQPVNLESLGNETEFLLAFGLPDISFLSLTDLKPVLETIETKILFQPCSNDWDEQFDLILPTALIAEKGGSLTNVEGRIQSFSSTLQPPGEGMPEWKALVDLAKDLKLNFNYYRPFTSPQVVFNKIGEEISFFRKGK